MRAGTLAVAATIALVGCGRLRFDPLTTGAGDDGGNADGDGGIDAPSGPPMTFAKVTHLAIGDDLGCAIRDDDTLWCWGNAFYGENLMGATDLQAHPTPSQVTGLSGVPTAVYAGGSHTCVVLDDGSLWCAGGDVISQLTATYPAGWSKTLQKVTGFSAAVTHVSIGQYHICAVTSDDKLWCWGFGYNGRLGNGGTANELVPTQVGGISGGVVSLSAGAAHTCVVTSTFVVYCWGSNANGQIGNGGGADVLSPTIISGGLEVVAGDEHTCIRLSTGGVTCWGDNTDGQLGDNTNTAHPSPNASLVADATALSAGYAHTCAMRAGGLAWCWGLDRSGQLGDGATNNRAAPVQVQVLGAVAQLASSSSSMSTCAQTTSNDLYCWGGNPFGALGNGHASFESQAAAASFANVVAVAPGSDHVCLVSSAGDLSCVGDNVDGQLGDSSTNASATPVTPSAIATASVIGAGRDYSGAVPMGTAPLYMFGGNAYSQLGDGSTSPRSTPTTTGLGNVVQIAADNDHTCARTVAKSLFCWGANNLGQVGDNSTMTRTAPVQVTSLGTTVEDACVGGQTSCALVSSGAVECWGSNASNKVGDNSGNDRKVPTAVVGLSSAAAEVACGDEANCARLTDGSIYCWGMDDGGEHGDGVAGGAYVPTKTVLPAAATHVAFGSYTGCAVLTDGRVFCWGAGDDGLLGHPDTGLTGMPVEVTGITGAVNIFVGSTSACVTRTDGSLWCWGNNRFGQLGRAYTGNAWSPDKPWLPAP